MSNVYYSPEQFGLTILKTYDQAGLSWEYNKFIVLFHSESGKVFYAQNMGNSCPTPFEDFYFKGPNDTNLTPVVKRDMSDLETDMKNWGYVSNVVAEVRSIKDEVKKIKNEAKVKKAIEAAKTQKDHEDETRD